MNIADEEAIKIIIRLRCLEGHVRSVAEMVEDDVYPINIVNRIEAIQAALEKINIQLLDRHLHTCLTTAINDSQPASQEYVLDRLAELFAVKSKYRH
jgi:DNA-binding FrmR family transcriptional regulator